MNLFTHVVIITYMQRNAHTQIIPKIKNNNKVFLYFTSYYQKKIVNSYQLNKKVMRDVPEQQNV